MIEFTPLKFDSTLSFSIGLAVCALVVPSITAFMNNRHDFKMKQLEYANTAKKRNHSMSRKSLSAICLLLVPASSIMAKQS